MPEHQTIEYKESWHDEFFRMDMWICECLWWNTLYWKE